MSKWYFFSLCLLPCVHGHSCTHAHPLLPLKKQPGQHRPLTVTSHTVCMLAQGFSPHSVSLFLFHPDVLKQSYQDLSSLHWHHCSSNGVVWQGSVCNWQLLPPSFLNKVVSQILPNFPTTIPLWLQWILICVEIAFNISSFRTCHTTELGFVELCNTILHSLQQQIF